LIQNILTRNRTFTREIEQFNFLMMAWCNTT